MRETKLHTRAFRAIALLALAATLIFAASGSGVETALAFTEQGEAEESNGNDTQEETIDELTGDTPTGDEPTGDTPSAEAEGTDAQPETQPTTQCVPECDKDCNTGTDCEDGTQCGSECEKKPIGLTITVKGPTGWKKAGTPVLASIQVVGTDSGEIPSVSKVEARIGDSDAWRDVTSSMAVQVSENCTVHVRVTDINGGAHERDVSFCFFDGDAPTLTAAISDGILEVQAKDDASGVWAIHVNGNEYKDLEGGSLKIRLTQFEASIETFQISAEDAVGNVSEEYEVKNPYYSDGETDGNGQDNPTSQLPQSATPTKPSDAQANVTEHTVTDSEGNVTEDNVTEDNVTEDNVTEDRKPSQESEDVDEEGEEEPKNLGKEFYTIETKTGKVFYLVIDRDASEETVYFLTEVTENDLLNVVESDTETLPKNSAALPGDGSINQEVLPEEEEDRTPILPPEPEVTESEEPDTGTEDDTPQEEDEEQPIEEKEEEAKDGNPIASAIVVVVLFAAALFVLLFLKRKSMRRHKEEDFVEDEEYEDEPIYLDDGEPEDDFLTRYDDDAEEQKEQPEEEQDSDVEEE